MNKKDNRIEEIIKVIQDIATGNYLSRVEISDRKDDIDTIATGINMLAEEVKDKVSLQARVSLRLADIIKQLQESRKQQLKTEELFRKVFESSPDSVLISTSEDGIVKDVNPGFCRLSGYSREDVIGKSGFKLNFWVDLNERKKIIDKLRTDG